MDFYAAQAVAEHYYFMLARVNSEIDAELEAFRTLRNGQELQEVAVDIKETSFILEENLYGDAYKPEPQFPELHERSAPCYMPQSSIPPIIEESEEEDFLPPFPV